MPARARRTRITASVTDVRPFRAVLPAVRRAVQAPIAVPITVARRVTAIAMIAIVFASDAVACTGGTKVAAHSTSTEAANVPSAKSSTVTAATTMATTAATCLRVGYKQAPGQRGGY
jgi:hypothetical protein